MDPSDANERNNEAIDANIVVLTDSAITTNDEAVNPNTEKEDNNKSEEESKDEDTNDENDTHQSLSVRSLPTYVDDSTNGSQNPHRAQVEALDYDEYNAFLDDLQTLVKHKRFETDVKPPQRVNVQIRRTLSLGETPFPSQFRSPHKKWPKIRYTPVTRRSFSASVPNLFTERRAPLTGIQIWTLVCLSFLSFTSFAAVSIIAPFFPNEASKKGMTESVSGMVFAVYGLVLMIMSPLVGKIIPVVGVKFVIISGIVCEGVSNILFGLLDRLGDNITFTVYCFVIRMFEGVGAASVSTASYAYIMKTFPDYVGTAFGLTETCVGLGMSLGPAIGGGLYALGGYYLPFFVLGCVVLINVPICWCIIQSKKECDESDESGSDSTAMRLTYKKLVSMPEVAVVCCVIVIVSQSVGFLDPTIEPHLRQFGVTAQYVGLVFLLLSAVYAICSPITGYIASRTENKMAIMLFGLLCIGLGLFLIGPAYFIPLKPGFTLTTGMMAVLGFATAVAFIPTFETILVTAIRTGYGDDINTYSLVSGLWSSMYALGEVTGPFLGGVLLEAYGFASSATIMGSFSLASAIAVLIVICVRRNRSENFVADCSSSSNEECKRLSAMNDDSRYAALEDSFVEKQSFVSQSHDALESPTVSSQIGKTKYPCCHHTTESSRLLDMKYAAYGSQQEHKFINSV